MALRHGRAIAGFVVAISLWWAAVAVLNIRPVLLPGPPEIADAFSRHGSYLAGEAWATLGHTLGGFTIAAVGGIAVAAILAISQTVREAILPMLVALQAVPKVAIAPLMIIWFGFGPNSKIALVVLLCFFPIVVSTLAGLTSTPAELIELSRSLSGPRLQTYAKIRIPWAAPQIFTGLKLAMSLALIGAVVAQITTPNSGLGAVIVASRQSADTPLAFAAIVLLAAIGIIGFYTLAAVERLLLPWARAVTS